MLMEFVHVYVSLNLCPVMAQIHHLKCNDVSLWNANLLLPTFLYYFLPK